MGRQAYQGRASITRRVAARILARGHGGAIAAEIDNIMYYQPCSRCGAWRCPWCRQLVATVWDHHPGCRYAPAGRAGAR